MRKSTPMQFLVRIAIYCLGLALIAVGVAISVNSNLGVSPVSSLPYIISQIIGVQLGTCVTVVYCCYIFLQFLILRREFKLISLLQIVFATIFGYFVDLAKWILGDLAIPTYAGRLFMLAISIILIAIGILMYLDTELLPMPMDGLITCIAKKLGKPYSSTKTAVDCIVVIIGIILCFVFLGEMNGIREGTIITAAVVGKLIAILRKYLTPIVMKVCFGE